MYIDVKPAAAGAPDLAAALSSQEEYVRSSLGVPIQPASQQPAEEAVLGSEEHSLGGDDGKAEFTLVLTRPGSGSGASGSSSGGAAAAAAALQQAQL